MSKKTNRQANKGLVNNQSQLEKQVNYPKIAGDLKMEEALSSQNTNTTNNHINNMLKSDAMPYTLVMIVALLLFAFLYLNNHPKGIPKAQTKFNDAIKQ